MSLEESITEYIDSNLNTITNQTSIAEAGQKMVELGVDCVFVLENEEIAGIVTQKDIMKAISNSRNIADSAKSIASKPIIEISSKVNVDQAIKTMKKHGIRRLVVKDDSKIVGIITQKKIFGNLSSKAFEIPELEMPQKIKCPYCSSLFQEKDDLSKHIDQVHIGYGVFQGNFAKAEDLGGISSPENYPKSL